MASYHCTIYDSCMTYETGVFDFEDFPQTEEPVWILGKKYSTLYDLEELRNDVKSKIWLTYRKRFPPIGDIGPTMDTGWGCMLRCGQMALAQTLINHHLGREWMWERDVINPTYVKILQMFQDKKNCIYSIHQIAQMGILEGKAIGQWFGPNTVAQVLKKLSVYDDWTSMVIHVAMDNTVIIDDIRTLCRMPSSSQQMNKPCNNICSTSMRNRGGINSKMSLENGIYFQHPTLDSCLSNEQVQSSSNNSSSLWRPLLLFIPLRLGLTEVNRMYIRSLKTTFKLKQSIGIIGGRPNHALYFIGIVGDELVFLDPHTTQPTTVLNADSPDDESYHCCYASRMAFTELDPSIALCFYFRNEADFDLWCNHVYKFLIASEKIPLFELNKERPPHWPTLESEEAGDYKVLEEKTIVYTTDNGFQLM
ncbi:cysteine protease ATG4B-like isoform X3 [Limulus polyphemus]|uniref:Cysteine protease n=1 Tax=Limulus polyphemus TaxID=6850 RepID=A0ABM1SJS2_LIMPO|nr:cysteine protease ATG4B-like isoform X3 [Limulus polyphemus]